MFVTYYNNKYIAINNYKQIKTSGTIDFTNSELLHTLPSNYVFYTIDSYSAINVSSTLFYPLPIYPEKFDFDDYMIYDDITNKIYVRSEPSALYNLNMIPQLLEVPINAS